jgi:hypothetical protein
MPQLESGQQPEEGVRADFSSEAPTREGDETLAAVDRLEELAESAVAKVRSGETNKRRGFTITKFGKHPDGYYHARVTPSGGATVYVFCKYGSWMAPGSIKGKAVLKEVVHKEVLEELARMARAARRKEGRSNGDTDTGEGSDEGPDADGEDAR